MLRSLLAGIRARVLLLVLLATIPAVAVMVASALEQRTQVMEEARRGTLRLAAIAARDHQEVIESARRLLQSLSNLQVLRSGDAETCRTVLSPLLLGSPHYIGLGIATPAGEIVCSRPLDPPPGYKPSRPGLQAVRNAWTRRDFAVSNYTVDAVFGLPMIVVAHAIPDTEDAGNRVLFASMRLDWLSEFAATIDLPEGSTLTATDLNGTVLTHHPDPKAWLGRSARSAEWFVARGGPDAGSTISLDLDGVERLHATAPLEDADGNAYGYATVGLPTSVIYAAQRRSAQRNLLWLLLAGLIALAAAWTVSDVFITKPLNKLLLAARRLESGDRTARSGLESTSDEIGELGGAFDEMAGALQAREEELEASAEALSQQALVFETVHEGVLITDPEGRVTEWNPGAERMFGYPRSEAIGRDVSFWHDPRVGTQKAREILGALQVKGRWSGEIPFVRGNGTRGVSEAVIVAQRDESGRAAAHVMVNRDVTDRKRSEAALRESELSYRILFNSLTELVYIQDLDGRLLNVNDALVDAYGYSREELLGLDPCTLVEAERSPAGRMKEAFERAVSGDLQRFELWARRKNGESFPKEIVLSKAMYFGRDVVIAVGRDMSEQKRAERALRESVEHLRHAQKMEAVGRLAGGIAHDFNNLLTAIRGSVELSMLDLPADSPTRTDLQQIEDATEIAASLTRQLLAFSRKQEARHQPLDINAVVASTGRLLQRPLGSDIELVLELAPDAAQVLADAGQMEQMVMNLALNARDAMPRGGRITISTDNFDAAQGDPSLPAYVKAGAYVRVRVSDTGIGMDAETQQHVFEPFFTTKEKDKGTGLGLFTVYGAIRGSGGHIWVTSEPDRGTTFTALIPRIDVDWATASADELMDGSAIGSETVLLVEDEDAIRTVTLRMLERMGYRVLSAPGGHEALEIAEEHEGTIDVLVTDMTMPRMSGRELAEAMVCRRPELRVVYMSGYTEEDIQPTGGSVPPGPFLHKPFSLEGLGRTVRTALDTRD
jgi:two-component system cell cycle sensor histidine kinase/response regulator CckA